MTGRDREAPPPDPRHASAPHEDDLQDMSIGTGDAEPTDGAIAEAFTALSLALKPVRPTAAMRARLLAAVTAPERRFNPFIGRLARLLDLAEVRVRELLDRLGDRAAWENV